MDSDSITNEENQTLTKAIFNSISKAAILENWKVDKYDLLSRKLIAFHTPIGLIRFYVKSNNREINLNPKDTGKWSKMLEYLESGGYL